jgi:hypothetical protein
MEEMDRIEKERAEEEIKLVIEMLENEDTVYQARQEEEEAYWRCEAAYWSYVRNPML